MGRGVDATATMHALGGIDAPQPPLIQEGDLSISSSFHRTHVYYGKVVIALIIKGEFFCR